jgi:sugar phosphate isomerase/epimerase
MNAISRRHFTAGAAASVAALAFPTRAFAAGSNFKIGVISDEISQDFDHACYVIAKDFGLHFVELREIWGKNLQAVTDAQIVEAKKIIAKYGLTQQDEVLERSISLAKQFGTNKVRCFDFWRIDDIKPYRAAINAVLQKGAETCAKQNIQLVLENEFACNTATGREAGATLAGVPSPNFFVNWDPGNAVMRGEFDAYPGGWDAIPKARIHHCHVKNAVKDANGKVVWSPVDIGYVDWTAQFKALKNIGYSHATNLETHWRGAGTPEASTRISWAGMKKCLEQAGAI